MVRNAVAEIGNALIILRLYVFFSAAYLTSLAVTVRASLNRDIGSLLIPRLGSHRLPDEPPCV